MISFSGFPLNLLIAGFTRNCSVLLQRQKYSQPHLSRSLPQNAFLPPKVTGFILESCWDRRGFGRQKNSLRAETAALCLERRKSLSSLWHHLDTAEMTSLAWSHRVWRLISASPLINYKCCLLPCTQCLQGGCKGIYPSSPTPMSYKHTCSPLPSQELLCSCACPKTPQDTQCQGLCFALGGIPGEPGGVCKNECVAFPSQQQSVTTSLGGSGAVFKPLSL